jgi:hypothetical protein
MNTTNPTRIQRKIDSDGIRKTLSAGWESIYADTILKKYFLRNMKTKNFENIILRNELGTEADSRWIISESTEHCTIVSERGAIYSSKSLNSINKRQLASPSVFVFSSGSIISPCGLVVTKNGNLIADSVGLPSEAKKRVGTALAKSSKQNGFWWTKRNVLENKKERRGEVELDTVCSVIPLWTNYYHWLIECLPRLRTVFEYTKEHDNRLTILVPPDRSSWMNDWIDLLNIRSNCRDLSEKHIKASNILVPTHPDPNYNDCEWLRNQILNPREISSESDKKIFISRSDATNRRISNSGKVEKVLRSYGFEQYVLSDLSIRKQANLFSEAETVIAPHGAGLANLVFSRDTDVIELFGRKKSTSYKRLAEINNLEYQYLTGQSDNGDILIDPDKLRQLIDQVCSNS